MCALIKKTPIVVNDSRGFFANRCVLAYILEGHLMFTEGVPPAMIEKAGKQAGMPVGPLSLNDEVGVDLGLKILQATKAQLGEAAIVPEQEAVAHARWSRRRAASAARTARASTIIRKAGRSASGPA